MNLCWFNDNNIDFCVTVNDLSYKSDTCIHVFFILSMKYLQYIFSSNFDGIAFGLYVYISVDLQIGMEEGQLFVIFETLTCMTCEI